MDEIRQLIKLKIEYYNMYYRYLSKSKYLTYASILEELLDEIENIPESITKYVEEMEGNKWLIGQMA